MAEPAVTEVVEKTAIATDTDVKTPTASAPEKTAKTFTQEELDAIVKERLAREQTKREAAEKAAKEKAEADALAKNAEWEKLAKQREQELTEAKAALKAKELADKKRTIAEKAGLPIALAARLVGETDEELERDAKALLETLPKPSNKPNPANPTNPGANGQPGETEAQKKARIFGGNPDPFAGGGVIWNKE